MQRLMSVTQFCLMKLDVMMRYDAPQHFSRLTHRRAAAAGVVPGRIHRRQT
ncbi:MAG: hypothetical protein ACOZJZ_08945 [Pseudomonadota bacterium]